jgi:hypothetical protein
MTKTGIVPITLEDVHRSMEGQRYRHYKGSEYKVICIGTQEDTGEPQVVYKGKVDDKIWIRPLKEFLDSVQVDGRQEQRFYLIRD